MELPEVELGEGVFTPKCCSICTVITHIAAKTGAGMDVGVLLL